MMYMRFDRAIEFIVKKEMEEIMDIESTFRILFPRLLEDPLGILCGAVLFVLVLRQEPEELIGGDGGVVVVGAGEVGEVGEGLGDVGRWARFGDGELAVEAAEHFVVVSGHGETENLIVQIDVT